MNQKMYVQMIYERSERPTDLDTTVMISLLNTGTLAYINPYEIIVNAWQVDVEESMHRI